MTKACGVRVRDTILWLRDTGEDELRPILCLHSLFLDGTMFDGLAAAAAGRFRVVRPDFRGQGGSAPPTEAAVSMETCAEDMIALIEGLGLAKVALIGASMGGDVAVRMAASRPDLFSALVLMGSSARSEPPDQKARFSDLLARTERTGFVGEDLELMMSIMFGATTRARPEAQTMLSYWRMRIGALSQATWPAMRGVVDRGSAVPLLAKISAPTLVYSSAEDIARPIDWSREVAEGIAGARLAPLPGVGHSPILEAPDVVIPRTLDFIDGAAG